MVTGNFAHDVQRLHEKYGDAVRLAPDEVSFAAPEAWHDIFDHRPEHLTFPKHPLWAKLPDGKVDPGLVTTTNIANHARMRKLMENSFTYKTLKSQEAIIQSYVTLLMTRFREIAVSKEPKGGVVNVSDWFNFTTFDIVGDLGFGEPFGCLENGEYHPWVALIFNFIQALVMTTMTRYYPILEAISMKLVPKSLLKKQEDHKQFAIERIHRRMNLETQRPDFMTPLIRDNKDYQQMSMEEIESTVTFVTLAGSETTATTLSGITNNLIQTRYSHVLQKLVSEILEKFDKEEDITMASTKDLPYLNAVVSEGLRACSPTPGGLPRAAPPGGGTVCGRWLPPNVSEPFHPPPVQTKVFVSQDEQKRSILTQYSRLIIRPMSPLLPTPSISTPPTSPTRRLSSPIAGFPHRSALRQSSTTIRPRCNHSAWARDDVSDGNWRGRRCGSSWREWCGTLISASPIH